MHEPPKGCQSHHPDQDDRVVVHRAHARRQRVGKAEHDVEQRNQQHRGPVDDEAKLAHVEPAAGHVAAPGEQVAEDGEGVGGARENDEAAGEVGKGGLATDADGAKGRRHEAGEDGGGDGTAALLVDRGEEAREGGRVVARERPPGAADGEEGADQAGCQREEDDEE